MRHIFTLGNLSYLRKTGSVPRIYNPRTSPKSSATARTGLQSGMQALLIADTPWVNWKECPVVDTVIGLGDLPLQVLLDRREANRFCVLGNHDTYPAPEGWQYLHGKRAEFRGLT